MWAVCNTRLGDEPVEQPRIDGLAQRLPEVVALLRVQVHREPLMPRLCRGNKKQTKTCCERIMFSQKIKKNMIKKKHGRRQKKA